MNCIVEVRPNVALQLISANYVSGNYLPVKNQTMEHLLLDSGAMLPTTISLLKILEVTEETKSAGGNSSDELLSQDLVFLATNQRINQIYS